MSQHGVTGDCIAPGVKRNWQTFSKMEPSVCIRSVRIAESCERMKRSLNLLGYQADEYIGHHTAEFHVDADIIAGIWQRLLGGETLYDGPARLRVKNGSIKDVVIHPNARWEEGGFCHTPVLPRISHSANALKRNWTDRRQRRSHRRSA